MGFRDIEAFNLSLLSKQGWRIIQYPDSLVATILREKYFPSDSFCDARVGSRPSYIWRSFCSARENLEGGLLWRVGNGESIKVWKDKWLPSSSTPKILSPVSGLDVEARVSSLIIPEAGVWNLPLLRSIFSPSEVELIRSIPLSPLGNPDRLIWQGTSHGCFSVKSAYKEEISSRTAAEGESSRRFTERMMWKNIWSLPGPPVLKHFIWRLYHNILPTKANLFHKKIVTDPLCPFCSTEVETSCPSIWSCPSAVAV